MLNSDIFQSVKKLKIHLVGIKGTGMAALAEILHARGSLLTGSDVSEPFYTDRIIERLGLKVLPFSEKNLDSCPHLVIFSAAYNKETNPDLGEADRRGIPQISYPEALGRLSAVQESCAIAGVHGKTTTTAITGALLKALKLPATILAGSLVSGFGDSSTLCLGEKFFVAETCEYRRHFLNFHPSHMIITTLELDHPDYFKDLEDVFDAFLTFACSLPPGGTLVYNADDPGTCELIRRLKKKNRDLCLVPYGFNATGDYRIFSFKEREGELVFRLNKLSRELVMKVPGEHNVSNAAGAVALAGVLLEKEGRSFSYKEEEALYQGLGEFRGSRRRSEIIGEAGGVLIMDDYAHHPTALRTTLKGLKGFYRRRLVVDFMSHTYSRTAALLEEFGKAFEYADEVILHKIYSSARERKPEGIDGGVLFEEVKKHHPRVSYFPEPREALAHLEKNLHPGDLFITMGAGDNWVVGQELLEKLKQRAQGSIIE